MKLDSLRSNRLNVDMPIDIPLSRKGLQKISRRPVVIPLEAIPDEILEQILSFCIVPEVLTLSLTCRRLFCVATGSLYRHVKPANAKKAIEFLLAVCTHENVGSFVRRCELELSFTYNLSISPLQQRNSLIENEFSKRVRNFFAMKIPFPQHDILRNPLALSAAALGKMPRLIHLELLFPEKEIQTDYNTQLLGACPFQLYHFHTNLRFDSAMVTFLKSQRHLQDFRFYSSTPFSSLDMTVLAQDMLPHLSSLSWSNRVPMELVRCLVKGRPIDTVNIFLLIGVYDILDLLAIGPSSCYIKRANVTFQDHRYPMYSQLNAINIHFPNLVGLGLTMVSLTEV